MNLMKNLVSKLSLWGLAALLFSAAGYAEEPVDVEGTESAESVEETLTQPSAGQGLIGSFEVRPSWLPNNNGVLYQNEFHTENNVILGYKFTPNTSVMMRQEFNTNINNPDPSVTGLNVVAKDLIAIGKFDNIWMDPSSGLSFSYEPRLYFPTNAAMRDAGTLGATRQYLKLTKVFNDTFSMTLMETPIVFMNQQAGTTDPTGLDKANPVFENRVYVVGDINFTRELTLSIPLIWNGTRYGQYGSNAAFSNTWAHTLWTYPELNYLVAPNANIGLAYMSENFLSYDKNGVYQGLNIKSGYEKGMFQAVLRATL